MKHLITAVDEPSNLVLVVAFHRQMNVNIFLENKTEFKYDWNKFKIIFKLYKHAHFVQYMEKLKSLSIVPIFGSVTGHSSPDLSGVSHFQVALPIIHLSKS